jgi:DNA-binding PadR family transcriptional regulator
VNNEQIILGLLYKKDRTGYELNEVFKDIFSHFYDASFGMIYPTLRRLAKNDLVSKKMVVQAGRPNKNLYTITPAGKKTFEASLTTAMIPDTRHSDFLMRLYFGEYESPAALRQLIQEQMAWLTAQIDKLQTRLQDWPNITPPQKLSFTIGIAEYQAQLQVLQDTLAQQAE